MKRLIFLGIFLAWSGLAMAQSTMEYVALTTTVAAAAKAREKAAQNQTAEGSQASGAGSSEMIGSAMTRIYGESSQVMSSRAESLLGQMGGTALSRPQQPALPPQRANPLQETPATKPESNNPPAENTALSSFGPQTDPSSKVYLKNGRVVQGEIKEEKDNSVKIDLDGTVVTFFKEEIDRIEKSS
jgi:hypothetical protein